MLYKRTLETSLFTLYIKQEVNYEKKSAKRHAESGRDIVCRSFQGEG